MNKLVTINENNQVTTTSRMIAEVFGKTHSVVMRTIQQLEIPEDFRKCNFALSSYHSGKRNYPFYEITREGWMFLVMGFTGEKAAEWKIKYIEAFNEMEKILTEILPHKEVEVQSYMPPRL